MARRSMFVALTKGFTSPPVPNGPASAFEGPRCALAGGGAVPSQGGTPRPQEPEEPERPRAARTGPLFDFDFPKRVGRPTSKIQLKPRRCGLGRLAAQGPRRDTRNLQGRKAVTERRGGHP